MKAKPVRLELAQMKLNYIFKLILRYYYIPECVAIESKIIQIAKLLTNPHVQLRTKR